MRQFTVANKQYGAPKQGRVVKLKNGKKITLHKNTPDRCSEPRRICIVCLTKAIRKNDKNYDSKVCKQCSPQAPTALPLGASRIEYNPTREKHGGVIRNNAPGKGKGTGKRKERGNPNKNSRVFTNRCQAAIDARKALPPKVVVRKKPSNQS